MPDNPARHTWGWFAAWAAVGAGYAFCLLALPSIGLFLLPVPVVATLLLVRRPSERRAATRGRAGLIAGAGLPLLYVAWLNRAGPGEVCTPTGTGQRCEQLSSPWPWLTVALLLAAAGIALHVARGRWISARRPARAPA
jgi:hypothetical protein